jgi:phage-related protein
MPSRNSIEFTIQAEDKTKAATDSASRGFLNLGTVVSTALGHLAYDAIKSMGSAVVDMVKDAAKLEGIEAAFEGIAKSAGKSSTELLKAFKKGSAGMISNEDAMLAYNKAAQLVSTTFANTLPDAMQYLSKISSATGQDMGFMTQSLAIGIGRLSPLILDNLGIQVDLNAAYEDYAKSIGKSVDALSKEEKQTALIAQVMQKLKENTAAMPDVLGQTDTLMAAFGATMKDIRGEIGKAFLPILNILLQTLVNLADTALPKIQAFSESMQQFFADLRSGKSPLEALSTLLINLLPENISAGIVNFFKEVEKWGGKVTTALNPVSEAFRIFKDALNEGYTPLHAMEAALWRLLPTSTAKTIIEGLDKMETSMKDMGGAFEMFITALQNGYTPLDAVKLAIWRLFPEKTAKIIIDGLDKVSGWLDTFRKALDKVAFILGVGIPPLTALKLLLLNFLPIETVTAIAKGLDKISETFEDWKIRIGAALTNLWQDFKTFWDAHLKPLLDAFGSAFGRVFGEVSKIIANLDFGKLLELGLKIYSWTTPLGIVGNLFKIFGVDVGQVITDIMDAFTRFFKKIGEGGSVMEALTAAVPAAAPVFAELKRILDDIGKFVTDTVIPDLQKLADWFQKDALPAARDFVVNQVLPRIQEFFNTLRDVWQVVGPALEELGKWFLEDVLPQVIAIIEDRVLPAVQEFFDFLGEVWEIVGPPLGDLAKWFLQDGLPVIEDFISDVFLPAVDEILRILSGIWDAVSPALLALLDWFVNTGLPEIGREVDLVYHTFIEPFINFLKGVWEQLRPALDSLLGWFVRDGIPKIRQEVENFWHKTIEPWVDFMKRVWENMKDNWEAFKTGVIGVLNAIVAAVQPVIDAINEIETTLNHVVRNAAAAMDAISRSSPGEVLSAVTQAISSEITGAPIVPVTRKEVYGPPIPPNLQNRDFGGPGFIGQAYQTEKGEAFIPGDHGTFIPDLARVIGNLIQGAGGGNALTINFAGGGPQNQTQANDQAAMLVQALRAQGVRL